MITLLTGVRVQINVFTQGFIACITTTGIALKRDIALLSRSHNYMYRVLIPQAYCITTHYGPGVYFFPATFHPGH